jgi:hypothetical protein
MPLIGVTHNGGIRVKSFDKEEDGNNHSLVGKQTKKMIRGRQGGFYL